jgi:inner membrane transporter RhtA
MAIAFVIVLPVVFAQAFSAANVPALLLAGIGVGVCSSVFPLFATNWQWHGCRLPVLV